MNNKAGYKAEKERFYRPPAPQSKRRLDEKAESMGTSQKIENRVQVLIVVVTGTFGQRGRGGVLAGRIHLGSLGQKIRSTSLLRAKGRTQTTDCGWLPQRLWHALDEQQADVSAQVAVQADVIGEGAQIVLAPVDSTQTARTKSCGSEPRRKQSLRSFVIALDMPEVLETRYVPMIAPPARHYSYECKASTQERPYVSRPSRSQQLRNPKLVPKLTSDTPNPLEKKKGVADEELAKIEAERERKRELEGRGEDWHLRTPSRPPRLMPQETLAPHRRGGELGLLPPSGDDKTVKTRRVMAVTAEARHLHDESGVQHHAIVDPPIMKTSREAIEAGRGSPLMTEEMMLRPLGSASVARSRHGAMTGGEVGRPRDRGHHNETVGHIEGEMVTAHRVAAVMKGREGYRPESEA
ncbi:hypothetical protein Trco_003014 [Trichoderma cornu-damae]|uniref:Uncharacterized protein n=1 Tax=Trichoderma cornu-damae TaxID=654480 RepID=A0A9P8TYJ6_9HYPO|nr:hypothetical protein Trco_003014 [Trichoderma cornu-damae]